MGKKNKLNSTSVWIKDDWPKLEWVGTQTALCRSAESHNQPSCYWLEWRWSFRYAGQLSCYLMSIYNLIYNLTHCGGLAPRLPHIRLPCSPAGCYSGSAVRCKKKEKRAHTVCSWWSHILKNVNTSSYPQCGQVDFIQAPSWRVTRHDEAHK